MHSKAKTNKKNISVIGFLLFRFMCLELLIGCGIFPFFHSERNLKISKCSEVRNQIRKLGFLVLSPYSLYTVILAWNFFFKTFFELVFVGMGWSLVVGWEVKWMEVRTHIEELWIIVNELLGPRNRLHLIGTKV